MGRNTVQSSRRIELTWLKRNGYFPKEGGTVMGNLSWSRNGEPSGDINVFVTTDGSNPNIRFSYKSRSWWERDANAWVDQSYSFPLERLPCRFGGFKWFIRCHLTTNGRFCGRRVRILYSTGEFYGCRHCANLTYESCNENKTYRSGMFGILSRGWKAEEYIQTLKKRFYRGRPTKKYRRFLRMQGGISEMDMNSSLNNLLNGNNEAV